MKRLIIFLIRRRLGLKLGEEFQFVNQKSDKDTYYFDRDGLNKIEFAGRYEWEFKPSNVSLNWLLNDECEIIKMSWYKSDEH